MKVILKEIDDSQQKSDLMNTQDENGTSVLYLCILNKKIEISQYLIAEGVDVNKASNSNAMTPLMIASANGYLDLVQQLIKNGAKVDARSHDKVDAAYAAAQEGHLSILKLLLKDSPYVADRAGPKGRTPLGTAAYNGHLDVVEYLVTEHNARINIKDANNRSPIQRTNGKCLCLKCQKCFNLCKVINFLKEKGANDRTFKCNCC